MEDKLVSVIIPTHDRAYSVVDAIRSVQDQTYKAVQIIVVDDGSRDNTRELLSKLDGIEYYYQEHGGQGMARNLGLMHAKGEFVSSLDSDDIWRPEFLTESVRCLEKHDLDFVFLNWKSSRLIASPMNSWLGDDKARRFRVVDLDDVWSMIDSRELRHLFLLGCQAPTSSYVMRRTSMRSWNEDVNADDWFLILEMIFSKPCRAAFTLSPFWLKRVFGDNIYDGRDAVEITENHSNDDVVMKELLYSRLTFREKLVMRKRMACTTFNLARLACRRDGISAKVVNNFAEAFVQAPVGLPSYIAERLLASLKFRFKPLPLEKRAVGEQDF